MVLIEPQMRHINSNTKDLQIPARTSMLRIRVEDDIKEQATAALTATGFSVPDAVRLAIVDQGLPLQLKVPDAETQAAMEESLAIMFARSACSSRFSPADAMFADPKKNCLKQAGRLATRRRLCKGIFGRLGAAFAFGALGHGATQAGDAAADCQRRTDEAAVAAPHFKKAKGRPPRLPYRRRLSADLSGRGQRDQTCPLRHARRLLRQAKAVCIIPSGL